MSEEEHTLRAAPGRRAVEEWALVLAAAGIAHRVAGNAGSWRLLVAAGDADRSIAALDAYDAERRHATAGEEAPEYGPTYAGLLVAVLLVGFYAVTGPADPGSAWARAGIASAELIVRGQGWRAVTALTLHANPAHLLGNAVACAVFVTAVGRALGPGLGGWLVLAAGAGGNVLNAFLHGAHHSAVGASTAVFGAIGLLGGLQFGRKRRRRCWSRDRPGGPRSGCSPSARWRPSPARGWWRCAPCKARAGGAIAAARWSRSARRLRTCGFSAPTAAPRGCARSVPGSRPSSSSSATTAESPATTTWRSCAARSRATRRGARAASR